MVIGSSEIPLKDEKDLAGLSITTEEGERLVEVVPMGEHRIVFHERRVSRLCLYNGDEFRIGEWSFRYRGDTPRRPR